MSTTKNLHIILQNSNEMKIRATRMLTTLINDVGTLKRKMISIKVTAKPIAMNSKSFKGERVPSR